MDWGMGPEIDESTAATTIAATTSIKETEVNRNEEEDKKRAAADDLKNRLEYQKTKNDKELLKEIMTRVS
jgi:hypothetical protein